MPRFLAAYPEIRLEVIAEGSFVDVLVAGCDAGIRYDEKLEQDMIAVPIGPLAPPAAPAANPGRQSTRWNAGGPAGLAALEARDAEERRAQLRQASREFRRWNAGGPAGLAALEARDAAERQAQLRQASREISSGIARSIGKADDAHQLRQRTTRF